MPMKGIRFLVTNGHTDIVKPDDPVQFLHQRTKQKLRISMRSDGIQYADERFVSCGHRKPRPLGQFFARIRVTSVAEGWMRSFSVVRTYPRVTLATLRLSDQLARMIMESVQPILWASMRLYPFETTEFLA